LDKEDEEEVADYTTNNYANEDKCDGGGGGDEALEGCSRSTVYGKTYQTW
jgi:hypothetical protein